MNVAKPRMPTKQSHQKSPCAQKLDFIFDNFIYLSFKFTFVAVAAAHCSQPFFAFGHNKRTFFLNLLCVHSDLYVILENQPFEPSFILRLMAEKKLLAILTWLNVLENLLEPN